MKETSKLRHLNVETNNLCSNLPLGSSTVVATSPSSPAGKSVQRE